MSFASTREYRLKFYLNAQHFFVNEETGEKGQTHPHTWEFCLRIGMEKRDIVPFHVFERGVNEYLEPYQNQVMNDCAPFDVVVPTLESMTEQFAKDFFAIVAQQGARLLSLEGSEGPTRSYIITVNADESADAERERAAQALSDAIDDVLDGILR